MKVSLVDIAKRLIKWDKRQDIYKNGYDNQYPERTDRLVNNSVTAKTATNIMTQYLIGKGFGDSDQIKVNKDQNLIEFAEEVAYNITKYRGVFIHVNYNLNYTFSDFKVLPFSSCRIGKKDDKKHNSKILIKEDWNDDKEKANVIDVFNPIKEVVKAQINANKGSSEQEKIEKYKGQVWFYSLDPQYYYPLSRIDAVMNDCDSEAQSALYKNQLLRKGFFGRTLVVTRPLIDTDIEETIYDKNGLPILNPEYRKARSEADTTKKMIEDFIGAENAGGAMLVEMEFAGDKLEEAILVKNIESNIEPDLFANLEESLRANILIAHNNLPIDLIKLSGGLSNSGEKVLQDKKTYWENTDKERTILELVINKLLSGFEKYQGEYLTVQPLLNDDNEVNNQDGDTGEETVE